MRYHPIVRRLNAEGMSRALIHGSRAGARRKVAHVLRRLRSEGAPREAIRAALHYAYWVGFPLR